MARLHDKGPLTEISQARPGWVSIVMTFDLPGSHVAGHAHSFDHDMTVDCGALRCVVEGAESVVTAGQTVTIAAHKRHSMWSLRSGTVARCEHEIRYENGALMPDAFSPEGIPAEWVARLTEQVAA